MTKSELLYYTIKSQHYRMKGLYYKILSMLSLSKDNKTKFLIAKFCNDAMYFSEKMCIKAGCYD